MPKEEAPVPWAVTNAAKSEPYPRKNVYFVGTGAEDVYNYCIWEAHVAGYTTLESKPARGMSSLIVDLLTRRYLEAMLDPERLSAFTDWATRPRGAEGDLRTPQPFLLAVSKQLLSLPAHSKLTGTLAEWELSSKEFQQLKRFCEAFRQVFGPMFVDDNAAEEVS